LLIPDSPPAPPKKGALRLSFSPLCTHERYSAPSTFCSGQTIAKQQSCPNRGATVGRGRGRQSRGALLDGNDLDRAMAFTGEITSGSAG
jgi:hypothetical protein